MEREKTLLELSVETHEAWEQFLRHASTETKVELAMVKIESIMLWIGEVINKSPFPYLLIKIVDKISG